MISAAGLPGHPIGMPLSAARDSEESMPWTAERFHQYVGEQLDLYSEEDFHYWLRQGQASPDAEGETLPGNWLPSSRRRVGDRSKLS